MPTPKPTILLDMDGVLTSYVDAVGQISPNPIGTFENAPQNEKCWEEAGYASNNKLWRAINERGLEFWSDMPVYPWASSLIAVLRAFTNVVICTSPGTSPNAAAGKMIAMQRLFQDQAFRDFMITARKETAASPSTFLIDDRLDVVTRFRAQGGHAALFPMPWNCERDRFTEDGEGSIKHVCAAVTKWFLAKPWVTAYANTCPERPADVHA